MLACILLLIHAFVTWMMIGIVWFVQVVYYPLYLRLNEHISENEKRDLKHMGYLVGPIFFFEAISAIILVFLIYDPIYHILAAINLGLLILVWCISAVIQYHHRGAHDLLFMTRMHHILLTTNWLRTLIWSVRGVIVLLMLYQLFATLQTATT